MGAFGVGDVEGFTSEVAIFVFLDRGETPKDWKDDVRKSPFRTKLSYRHARSR